MGIITYLCPCVISVCPMWAIKPSHAHMRTIWGPFMPYHWHLYYSSPYSNHFCPIWVIAHTSAHTGPMFLPRGLRNPSIAHMKPIWDPFTTVSLVSLLLQPTFDPLPSHMGSCTYFCPYWTHIPLIWAIKTHEVPTCHPYGKCQPICAS